MVKQEEDPAKRKLALHQLPGELFSQADVEGKSWFESAPSWPEESENGLRGTKSEWLELAGEALEGASRMFEKKVNGSFSDSRRVLDREKTVGDKIAAVALLIQESPLHRLDELYSLLSFAKKKGRNERGPAIDALKDLFVNNLLPDGRRLIPIHARSFRCERSSLTKRHLAYALFESELKTIYAEFLEVLEESGKDSLAYFKQKALKVVNDLLLAKPENEQTLLAMLVNKLGDPERRISSDASFKLSALISKHHPQMRVVVVREVEQLLLRSNISKRAQYFAVSFLNSIRFDSSDVELARRLIRLYMDMFAACLTEEREENKKIKEQKQQFRTKRVLVNGRTKKVKQKVAKEKDDVKNSRLMGALLIGANKAFPFTKPAQDNNSYEKHYAALYHVAHAQSLEPATRSLAFLFQVSQANSTQSDRFYRALYSRLMDIADVGDTVQAPFLNLVFKALKSDTNPKRVRAFVKRLLQAGQCGSSGFAASCILAISEALNEKHEGLLKSFVSLPEGNDDEEVFVDADKEADKANDETLKEHGKKKKKKKGKKNSASEPDSSDSEPELERNGDLTMIELNGGGVKNSNDDDSKRTSRTNAYDPLKRDPQFARAENSALWEAVSLGAHYHPSISKFALTMCVDMKKVVYNSDPLDDFSDIAFLDKFIYKKAKNRLAKSLYGKKSSRYRDEPLVNSLQFQEQVKSGKVDASEVFFARFFQANPNKVQSEQIDAPREKDDTGYDSEEEAFEVAMREEMKRLGADAGFFSEGMTHHAPDVDEEDEDEMKAFAAAFEDDMVPSDESDDEGNPPPQDTVVPLPAFEETDSTEANNDLDDSDEDVGAVKQATVGGGVFAAAEDFEEAIDEELARSRMMDENTVEEVDSAASKKRKGPVERKKSKSKRRKRSAA